MTRSAGANPRAHDSRLIVAAAASLLAACVSNHPTGPPPPDSAQAVGFLDTLEQRTFNYFWSLTNPTNGLTPDRSAAGSFSSIAAVGFALTAYPIGVARGYVTRAAAAQRALTTLQFFWTAPQNSTATSVTGYKGFFYHFLDMSTGQRYQTIELSTMDTALLLAGVLTCQSYFTNTSDSVETAIRTLADSIYRRVDWQWAENHPPAITLAWTPESGFSRYDWRGYNEAMLVYILAFGSPTHPADSTGWATWTSTYQWGTFEGQTYLGFGPLFGHQYSHVWIDFRGIQDAYMAAHGIDYFENTRRATYAQRSYAIANPGAWVGYGDRTWGLTASDGPANTTLTLAGRSRTFHTYWARGASFTDLEDDGTMAPTAAGGSLPFAPEIALPALWAMRDKYGENLFSTYGFFDAFNPTFTAVGQATQGRVDPVLGWFDTDYLGIDEGPILVMAENYRTGLVWQLLRTNPYVVRGLCRAGFSGGWLTGQCP